MAKMAEGTGECWRICCPSIPVHAQGFTSEQRLLRGAGLTPLRKPLGGDPYRQAGGHSGV